MKIENITDSDMVDPWECTCARCGETDLVTRHEFIKADGQVYHPSCLIDLMNETIEKLTANLNALDEARLWEMVSRVHIANYAGATNVTSGSAGVISNDNLL